MGRGCPTKGREISDQARLSLLLLSKEMEVEGKLCRRTEDSLRARMDPLECFLEWRALFARGSMENGDFLGEGGMTVKEG